jgi:putative intracellular protease/amidase
MTKTRAPRILLPLPDHDFDPTETATPWKVCRQNGWEVSFATEHGAVAAADHRLLMGPIRGPLGAGPKALAAYREMIQQEAYRNPIRYSDIDPAQFEAVSLTGGHAPGMKPYLESRVLQGVMAEFFRLNKVIGAICHGVLVLARAANPETGKSILHDKKVTALTKDLERSGYALTFWLLGRRYRTYECYVADEVRAVLSSPDNFKTGKSMLIPFTYRDGNLLTSRWPLDAAKYAREFAGMIREQSAGAG